MTKTYRRKFAWGTLWVKADWGSATYGIRYCNEDLPPDAQSWASTPFMVAAFAHDPQKALSGVNKWLKTQAQA